MNVFVAGATGYMGTRVVERLLARGHTVRALARSGSERKLPPGVAAVMGNALDSRSYVASVQPADVIVHLVGVAHPAPWKEEQFRAIDLVSLKASIGAAQISGVRRIVYVSVAHPAPAMKAYIRVREQCEQEIAAAGLDAAILRPWYVLGPGHRWPVALIPFYKLLEHLPATRETALRLGLVTIAQMIAALVWAVENPARGLTIIDVPQIRATPAALGASAG